MPLVIKLEDSALRAHLQQLQAHMQDLSPAMDRIAFALEQNLRQRFETRQDPSGKAWAAWAPSTRRSYPWPGSKAAKGKDGAGRGKLLERYTSMMGGISSAHDKTTASVGFDQIYAAHHEWGTRRMKRRGLLTANPQTSQLGEKDKETVLHIVQHFLQPN